MELGLQIIEFAQNAYSLFIKLDVFEQARFLKIILSKCILKDGILVPEFKKPFDVLIKMPQNIKWYPQGNSNPCRLREREVS